MASTEASTFWLISIPNSSDNEDRKELDEAQRKQAESEAFRLLRFEVENYCELTKFVVPRLRLGTLDRLMSLSDDLGKIDQQIETVVKKIERTYSELKGAENKGLAVDDATPEAYCKSFAWKEQKNALRTQLDDLVEQLQDRVFTADEELKRRLNRYQEVQTDLGAIERKETGTLLVKPLGDIVDQKDYMDSEFLTTLFVVVPKARKEKFLASYEILEDLAAEAEQKAEKERVLREQQLAERQAAVKKALGQAADEEAEETDEKEEKVEEKTRKLNVRAVVPRSAKELAEDSEFVLFRILCLKKGADTIRTLCRQERFTCRHFRPNTDRRMEEKDKKAKLTQMANKRFAELQTCCEIQYTDVFSDWIHLKAVRVFVESVLRYGIPINFQAVLLKPRKGYRTKLRKILHKLYSHLAGHETDGETGAEAMVGMGQTEFFPYVYLPINLDDN